MLKKFLLILSLVSISPLTYANNDGWYIGLQLGHSDVHYSANDFNLIKYSGDFGATATSSDNTGNGWRAYAGYNFNSFLAMEAGFMRATEADIKNLFGFSGLDLEIQPVSLDLVGKISVPISNFSLYAKLGIAYVEHTTSIDANKVSPATAANISFAAISFQDDSEFAGVFGIGASYKYNEQVTIDLSWTRTQAGGRIEDTDFAAIGFNYHLC